MTTYSSILAWRIPWTEDHGRLWSMGSQRVKTGLKQLSTQAPTVWHREPYSVSCSKPQWERI